MRLISRQYNQYINMRVKCKLALLNLLEQTMPQITTLSENDSRDIKRDKLNAFQASHLKVEKIYILASSKIPTLSSQDPSTKM